MDLGTKILAFIVMTALMGFFGTILIMFFPYLG